MGAGSRNLLRHARALLGRAIGAGLAGMPGLERPFVALGSAAGRRSRWLGTLYWAAEEDLVWRLRRSGACFRRAHVAGGDMVVDITDATGRLLYFHGEPYEPETAEAIAGLLRAGDAFVDVGANIGYFSVIAARAVGPDGAVVAFEPDPTVLPRLRAMLAANHASVEVVQAAVTDVCRHATIHMTGDSVLTTLDPSRAPLGAAYAFDRQASVPAWSLDDWLGERSDVLPRLRLLKIDVEGTEDDVVAGARQVLAASRPSVICETHPGSGADRTLSELGYTRRALDPRGADGFGNYLYEAGP